MYRFIVVYLLSRRNPPLQHCCKDSMRATINPCSSANPRALLCIKSGLLKHLDTPECCLRPIFWNQSDISQLNLNPSFKTELEKKIAHFSSVPNCCVSFFCNLLCLNHRKGLTFCVCLAPSTSSPLNMGNPRAPRGHVIHSSSFQVAQVVDTKRKKSPTLLGNHGRKHLEVHDLEHLFLPHVVLHLRYQQRPRSRRLIVNVNLR